MIGSESFGAQVDEYYPFFTTAALYTAAIIGMLGAFFSQEFWLLVVSFLLLSLSAVEIRKVFRRYQRGLAEKVVNYNKCENGILIRSLECPPGPWIPSCTSQDDRAACTKKCIAKDVWGDD